MLLRFDFYSPYLPVTLHTAALPPTAIGFHDWSHPWISFLASFLYNFPPSHPFHTSHPLLFSCLVPLVIFGRITWSCISSTFLLNSKTVYSITFKPSALRFPTKTFNSTWPTLNLSLTINPFLNCSLILILDFSLSEWYWYPPS